MSAEAVRGFRRLVDSNDGVKEQLREAMSSGKLDLIALGSKHGFQFTEAELEAASADGELSDFELELVSGGALSGVATGMS